MLRIYQNFNELLDVVLNDPVNELLHLREVAKKVYKIEGRVAEDLITLAFSRFKGLVSDASLLRLGSSPLFDKIQELLKISDDVLLGLTLFLTDRGFTDGFKGLIHQMIGVRKLNKSRSGKFGALLQLKVTRKEQVVFASLLELGFSTSLLPLILLLKGLLDFHQIHLSEWREMKLEHIQSTLESEISKIKPENLAKRMIEIHDLHLKSKQNPSIGRKTLTMNSF